MLRIFLICAVGLLSGLGVSNSFGQSSAELQDVQMQVKEMFKRQRYHEAVPFAQKAIQMSEEEFGSEHPTTAAFIFNLAKLYQKQSQYKNAEPLYKRALAIRENSLGNGHAEVAASYNSLGQLYDAQGQLADAEHFYSLALDVMTVALADDPHVINAMSRVAATYRAQAYHNRARLLHEQENYGDAENLFGAAMVIMRSTFGEKHAEVARAYENYAALLRDMGRPEDAAEKEEYARAIRARRAR